MFKSDAKVFVCGRLVANSLLSLVSHPRATHVCFSIEMTFSGNDLLYNAVCGVLCAISATVCRRKTDLPAQAAKAPAHKHEKHDSRKGSRAARVATREVKASSDKHEGASGDERREMRRGYLSVAVARQMSGRLSCGASRSQNQASPDLRVSIVVTGDRRDSRRLRLTSAVVRTKSARLIRSS